MSETAERLHQVGLKATAARMILLAALEQDRSHPTAEQLFERLRAHHPSLSLSTVYQTLDAFMRTGLCARVSDAGDRLRVDGTPQDHHHAVCRVCGTIFDVRRQLLPLPTPPAQLPYGLTVTGLRVEYEVICATCGEAGEDEGLPSLGSTRHRAHSHRNTERRRVKKWLNSKAPRPMKT